jgi:glycosyltransferase involved in cell wall biosynthesis
MLLCLKLIIVHNHFRPGGVRRVIELAAPCLVRQSKDQIEEVVIVTGESPSAEWKQAFALSLKPAVTSIITHPSLGYVSDLDLSPTNLRAALAGLFKEILGSEQARRSVIWAHNQGLGRNLLIAEALLRAVKGQSNCDLVLHHHDWWFDNRWSRWREMQRCGFRSLAEVASVIFAAVTNVHHIAISRFDSSILQRFMPERVFWLPNPIDAFEPSGSRSVWKRRVKRKRGTSQPMWLMPCRLLRRKNIAEGLLLTRWLRPDATLVTTAGISSPGESAYADALEAAATRGKWPLRLGILSGKRDSQQRIRELLHDTEAILLTSLQEGFGLPYIEAAAASRPLFARRLPNIAPDLQSFGLRLPYIYREILIDPSLFNWRAEVDRQERRFRAWLNQIPRALRTLAGTPAVLTHTNPHAVPFSRLTLRAQIEVLSNPLERSWSSSLVLNPWLGVWRDLATSGRLKPCRLSRSTATRLAPERLAKRFWGFLGRKAVGSAKPQPALILREFATAKLAAENLFPLTWGAEP